MKRRAPLIVLLVVAAAALVVTSFVAMFVVGYGTCSGDGGSPFSANDSVAGRFCDGPLIGPWYLLVLIAPVAVLGGVGALAVRRLSLGLAAAAVGAGAATIVALSAPILALPDTCSDEDQRAYDEWIERDRAGPRPADCETY